MSLSIVKWSRILRENKSKDGVSITCGETVKRFLDIRNGYKILEKIHSEKNIILWNRVFSIYRSIPSLRNTLKNGKWIFIAYKNVLPSEQWIYAHDDKTWRTSLAGLVVCGHVYYATLKVSEKTAAALKFLFVYPSRRNVFSGRRNIVGISGLRSP